MKTLVILAILVIVGGLVFATAGSFTASVFAKSTGQNFGQCQKAQIERFASHDFAHDFCKGVP
jgi:hypothetical protein